MRLSSALLATGLLSLSSAQNATSPNPVPSGPLQYGAGAYICPVIQWPRGPGYELGPQLPDHELQQVLEEISAERIEAIIAKLVSYGTRHTLSDQTSDTRGIGAAARWIESEMRMYAEASDGRMEVTTPSYIQRAGSPRIPFDVRITDIVATLRGSVDPDRYYVISGHYDSRVSDPNDYTSDAPGANDDASGVAVSMELARIFATRRPASTLVFVAVAGEEQGLFGAQYLAETYRNASVNVAAMATSDIVGSSTADDGTRDPYTLRLFAEGPPNTETARERATRLSTGGENDSPARELARHIVEVASNAYTRMRVQIIYRLDRFLRGGDHRPFLQNGYAAVRFTEPNEVYEHQHNDVRVENGTQYGDLIEFVDFDYVSRVARVNAAMLWSLSEAPGQPTNVTIDTAELTNDSSFQWLPPAATDPAAIAGYEVVWRPIIAPLWTHAIYVGNVNQARVDLSKDNVIFGIRSVGKNGMRSPAVWPFPGGAGAVPAVDRTTSSAAPSSTS